MEDDKLAEAIKMVFMTDFGQERLNIVDALFAIADNIKALDATVGAEPTIDMNKDLCKALESMGSSIGGAIQDLAQAIDK